MNPREKYVLIVAIVACHLFGLLTMSAQSTMYGIGADMVITHWTQGDHLQIVGVASNSPASQAGLMPGQFILAIDNVPTAGLKLADCVRRIQGKDGTQIVLEIGDWRHRWTNSITLTRKVIAGDPLAVDARRYEVPESLQRRNVSLTTNQILQVSTADGMITAIQFTDFGATNASYHWRSRSADGTGLKSGSGRVFENCWVRTNAYGEHELIYRNRDDLYVKTGNLKLEWSFDNTSDGWIYYHPSEEKVAVLNSVDFNSDAVWLGADDKSVR